jgi:hypothetical protein
VERVEEKRVSKQAFGIGAKEEKILALNASMEFIEVRTGHRRDL